MDRRGITGETMSVGTAALEFRIEDIRPGRPGFRGRLCGRIRAEGNAGIREEGDSREDEGFS